jgi:hypothetical protein
LSRRKVAKVWIAAVGSDKQLGEMGTSAHVGEHLAHRAPEAAPD